MIKKFSAFIFAFLTFLSFPFIAFADFSTPSFTASSQSYNHTTKNFSFTSSIDLSDVTSIDLIISDRSNEHITGSSCSGTTCSGTLTVVGHNMDCTDTAQWETWNGTDDRSSQTFTIASIDSSCSSPTPTPTPVVKIVADPSSSTTTVGTPFNVDVKVTDTGAAFNAAQATVALSSNLSVTGIHAPSSNACNLQYTKHPKPSDLSFAGAIFGSSSTGCTIYTMTLTPNATGIGTITFTNSSIKAYSDNAEILTGVQNGSFTIADGPTPTPTAGVPQLTITSPLLTYLTSYTLAGGKDSAISHVFINASESGVTFPTSTTWQAPETLSLGDNTFTIYGTDDSSNQTATQTIDVNRHTLGDINGDGNVDLIDASLFAVDFGKTSNLTYILSDMNGDGSADLTDLSILAKLEQ